MAIEESTISKMRTRPRFKMCSTLSPTEYERHLKQFLAGGKEEFCGNINRETAHITVRTETDSYWKPRLALRAESEGDKTVIRGMFGPSPSVWTFFMFAYGFLGVLFMVAVTVIFVERQINSNDFPWALPAAALTAVLAAVIYFAARYGQYKAKDEMQKLRQFAERSTLPFEDPEELP